MKPTSRKEFLRGVALGAVAMTGAAALSSCVITPPEETPSETTAATPPVAPELPWPYTPLDPVAVAERAYAAYYNGGCMYGAFEGIIGELREVLGGPYAMMPTAMMKYGAAGVSGWGTLCGALNGAAAAIFLLTKSNPIINEVFAWHGVTELPNYKPKTPKFEHIPAVVPGTQLCHISVTRWCEASGFAAASPERAERCGWLTASVAKYTVEILNQQAASAATVADKSEFKPVEDVVVNLSDTYEPVHSNSDDVKLCLSCHGKGGIKNNVHAFNQTSCTTCHFNLGTEHPFPIK